MISKLSFKSLDSKFGLAVPDHQVSAICGFCLEANDIETGGILVGEYNDTHNLALVSEALPAPPDSRAGPTWFERGTQGLKGHLRKAWKERKEFYLGEWHFHPNASPTRSDRDLKQMDNVLLKRAFQCPEPVLLIVGGFQPHWSFKAYVYPHNKVEIELFSEDTPNFGHIKLKE